ncbi:MAG: HlyD family efflux transporter periplasmic adaptor subunit, partial [Blautia sp.]|nr:HlyD family efflux transporter periplasmic adaptor subunit [Blautia sp.]
EEQNPPEDSEQNPETPDSHGPDGGAPDTEEGETPENGEEQNPPEDSEPNADGDDDPEKKPEALTEDEKRIQQIKEEITTTALNEQAVLEQLLAALGAVGNENQEEGGSVEATEENRDNLSAAEQEYQAALKEKLQSSIEGDALIKGHMSNLKTMVDEKLDMVVQLAGVAGIDYNSYLTLLNDCVTRMETDIAIQQEVLEALTVYSLTSGIAGEETRPEGTTADSEEKETMIRNLVDRYVQANQTLSSLYAELVTLEEKRLNSIQIENEGLKQKISALTEEGSNVPGDGSAKPTEGSSVPGDGSAETAGGSNVPGDGSAKPTEGSSVPGDGSVETAGGSSVPEDGNTEPPGGSSAPGDGNSIPANGGNGAPSQGDFSGGNEEQQESGEGNPSFTGSGQSSPGKSGSGQSGFGGSSMSGGMPSGSGSMGSGFSTGDMSAGAGNGMSMEDLNLTESDISLLGNAYDLSQYESLLEQEPSDADAAAEYLVSLQKALRTVTEQYAELHRNRLANELKIQYRYDSLILQGKLAEITYQQDMATWKETLSEAEQKREELEEQRALLEEIPDGMLYAKEDGVIASVMYETDDPLNNNTPLLYRYDMNRLDITIAVPQGQIASFVVGDTVEVTLSDVFETDGTIREKSTEAQEGNGRTTINYEVKVSVENENGLFSSGMAAIVTRKADAVDTDEPDMGSSETDEPGTTDSNTEEAGNEQGR